jgi:uncharacterized NAD-dependent epimerase/dehydratase family protein
MTRRRYVILAPGVLGTRAAKTAHGVIAYAEDRTVAVIDPDHAGKTVRDVLPYLDSDAPIVSSVQDALMFAPTTLLIGIAPAGGSLPRDMRCAILEAITAGLEIISGLHQLLGDDEEFARAASFSGTRIWDVRRPPRPRLFDGSAYDVPGRVLLTVGTDCAVGKMTTSLEIVRAARAAGVRARFVATGQTGIVIAGSGTAVDCVVSDFATGAVEEIVTAAADADLIVVEGQGSINHPAFAPVTLALVFGAAPDAMVLVHRPNATTIDRFETPLLGIPQAIAHYEAVAATVKPAKVVGVALCTLGMDETAAREAVMTVRRETGVPCEDIVRFGTTAYYEAIAPAIAHKTQPLHR